LCVVEEVGDSSLRLRGELGLDQRVNGDQVIGASFLGFIHGGIRCLEELFPGKAVDGIKGNADAG